MTPLCVKSTNPADHLAFEIGRRHEQIQLALFGPHLRQIDVDIPERIRAELPTGWRPVQPRQPANPVALESRCNADRVRCGIVA